MEPGPIKYGWPQDSPSAGISVVKETTVVSKPGKDPEQHRRDGEHFANLGFASHRLLHGRERCVAAVHQADEKFGLRVIGNDVGRAAARDGADVERARAQDFIHGKRHAAHFLKRIQQFLDGRFAQLGISRMRHASAGHQFQPQRALGSERQLVFGGFAVDQEFRAAR